MSNKYNSELVPQPFYNSTKAAHLIHSELRRGNFMKWLREMEILNPQNLPSAEFINRGYCKIEYINITSPHGRILHPNDPTVRYSVAGIEYMKSLYISSKAIPVASNFSKFRKPK